MLQSTLRPLPPTPVSSPWRRALQALAALGLLAATLSASAVGCGTPEFCPGGFIRTVNGVKTCEGVCSPTSCKQAGNVCVNNLCALECTANRDCAAGEQCVPATTDGASGKATNVCRLASKSGIGVPCPNGNECGGLAPSCPDGSNCDFNQCGGDTCTLDAAVCGSDPTCAVGKCPDGSACTVQGCTQDQCKPLTCLSGGVGDAAAYCTLPDCAADTDCGTGLWCSKIRDPHPICGAPASKLPGLCGISCASNVGCTNAYGAGATCNSGICAAPCVMAGAGGASYAAGPFCTMRNECKLRGPCDPCTTDLDCSGSPGRHCTTMPKGGDKFCTVDCGGDSDCGDGFQCTNKECVPRFGTCKSAAPGNFCEPCHFDADCAAGLYCSRESSGVEKICVAPIGGTPCTSDAQCPTSPSGLHGICMDSRSNSSPGDGVYHTCWLPYFASVNRYQCWAENAGAACGVNKDCLSNMCVGADPATGALGLCK